jgi:LPXTG-site transpeptidase (sortase) family protein
VVNSATPIQTDLTNTAITTWTSMPGTAAEERTGEDGIGDTLDDYADEDSETVTFHGVDLLITKADSPTTITPSIPATPTTPAVPSVLRYTIDYSNMGDIDATNVVVTETVPPYTRFNKLTSTGGDTLPPTGWDCADQSAAGTTCHFNIGTVAAGGSGSLYFDVVIDEIVPADTTQILNTVIIEADEKERSYTNNTDDEATPLTAAPDMAISKTDGVNIISSGIELTYTLTVRNNGSEGATGVVVTDTLPYHVTYVNGSATPAFTSMTTVPAPVPTDPSQTTITWNVTGEVPARAELTFTYRVLVEDIPAGVTQIVNTATVADDGTNGEDPTPEDNTSTDTDYLATLPNTNLSKTVESTSEASTLLADVTIGESLVYRVTFALPPGDLPAMTLTDSLPPGLAFGECLSITSTSPLVTNNLTDQFDSTCNTPVITAEPSTSLEPADQGRNVLFNFGDVNNAGTGKAYLTLDYTVYVLDSALNIRDVNLVNLIHWKWGTDNDLQTESSPVTIVEPSLNIGKVADPTHGRAGTVATYTLTVAHTAESNATAFDVLVQDTLPKGIDYIPGTLQVISGPAPDLLDELGAPLLQIGWDALPARDAFNNPTNVVIEYQGRVNNTVGQGTKLINDANVVWSSLPGDLSDPQTPNNLLSTERFFDPGDAVNIYSASTLAEFVVPKEDVAPATGFAPGVITNISGIPVVQENDLGSVTLEIPALGVKLPVVGISATIDGWDLSWLGNKAGWLEGTAYPTWEGNTAITAHVYLSNGKPGPFVNLKNLHWGDRFYILEDGMRYTYEVRITTRVRPDDKTILAHEKLDWVTLITCAGYDEVTNTYKWRDIVKAVLIMVDEE